MNSGKEGSNSFLGRNADDDTGDTYGGKERRTDPAEFVNAQESRREAEKNDHDEKQPLEDHELGSDLSGMKVFLGLQIEPVVEIDLKKENSPCKHPSEETNYDYFNDSEKDPRYPRRKMSSHQGKKHYSEHSQKRKNNGGEKFFLDI